MIIAATEFKAKCLALLDRVHESGEPVLITKRGRVVASLIAEGDRDLKPWLKLHHTVVRFDDPTKPAIGENDVEALK